jgi:phenylalanyl-tRNA synthetase beta chain
MNASVNWLSAFVDSGLTPEALRDILTARVATVDAVEPLGADLTGIVVGRVTSAVRHPDSDHLWITQVDAGRGETVQVICGAANVAPNVLYPFAPVGTTMPNGMKIERRKIRGELSNGMLCSARELQLGSDHDGILALSVQADPGTPVTQVLRASDTRLVVDVSPSRPDLLCHLGIAREIAAATSAPLATPAIPIDLGIEPPTVKRVDRAGGAATVRVTVDDAADCPTYLGAVVRGVRVGPSPDWLSARLAGAGVRSINNVVDVTNYMLFGYGQPMHVFDLSRVAGPEVHVRRARDGEGITTLDGVGRRLDASMLVIADSAKPQAIAGVIGGQDSQVSESTTDLFLEMAAFDPIGVRRTRRALGIMTDAAHRYERLVPPISPIETYATALRLLVALAGGRVDGSPVVVGSVPAAPEPIRLRTARVERLLGVRVPAEECAALLRTVGFGVRRTGEDLTVSPPSWRTDARAEIDLVEEVARLRGYSTFPDELRPFRLGTVPDDPLVSKTAQLRELMTARGFLELRPMPFSAAPLPDGLSVRVINPLADTEAYLRRDVVDSLARSAELNLAHMEGDLRLFEIGTVFERASGDGRPREEVRLGALCMGARRPRHFTEPNPPHWDAWDAKALAESVAAAAYPDAVIESTPGMVENMLWQIRAGDRTVGHVQRARLDAPPWASPAFSIEVTVAVTDSADVAPPGRHREVGVSPSGRVQSWPRYNPPPAYPAVQVDVTLGLPEGVTAAAVERILAGNVDNWLERIELISEYRGHADSAPRRATRRVTWRLTFRHPERTLREKEVEARRDKLLRALESELGVRQPTS